MTFPYPYQIKMASTANTNYDFPGKADVRLLPTAAHEVSCVLLYSIESPSGNVENVCLGQIDEDLEDLPPVLVCTFFGDFTHTDLHCTLRLADVSWGAFAAFSWILPKMCLAAHTLVNTTRY